MLDFISCKYFELLFYVCFGSEKEGCKMNLTFAMILLVYIFVGCAHGFEQNDESTWEPFMTKFQEYNDVIDYLNQMARKYPNLIELETIGYTVENRQMVLAKIGAGKGQPGKPSIWIDSAMHAREWISVSVSQFIIDTLLKNYDSDNSLKNYVDKLTWYILPIMNPDGYEYSREKDYTGSRTHFLWRKNRRPSDCVTETCRCNGVDLNRNFGYKWGENLGSHNSNDSCDEQYIGPRPFSERESSAVQDFILRHTNTMKAYLTLHSYAQMWFYPYGYQKGVYPDDVNQLQDLAYRATAALRNMYGTSYQIGSTADIYYPASGSACDWAKGVAGIKYVYGIELRPQRDTEMAAFLLPWQEIAPTVKETWAAIKIVADEIIQNYSN